MNTLFLAVIIVNASMQSNQSGVQIEIGGIESQHRLLVDGTWLKYSVDWNGIEQDYIYYWGNYDHQLSFVPDNNPLLLTVHNSPIYHRLYPDKICSPLLESSYDDYAEFIGMVIDRYHPEAIEIWNEPDMPFGTEFQHLFGCYDNGQQYADMVNTICPLLKEKYPDVTFVVGALADIKFADYLVGNSCDVIGIHSYPEVKDGRSGFDATQAKVDYLKQLGFERIWITETSLLDSVTDDDRILQGRYFDYLLFDVTGIENFFWYTIG